MTASADAPASAANLGPGFDVLALALELRCRVAATGASEWSVVSAGSAADAQATGWVRDMARRAAPGAGPFAVTIDSDIPIGTGLGSSAALVVAAGAAMRAEAGLPDDPGDLLAAAAGVEGHPDNVAAAVHGGLVAVGPSGAVLCGVVASHLRVLVAVPSEPLATEAARRALRPEVPLAVVGRTVGRVVFLVEGLRTGERRLLAEAAGDEVHEEQRVTLSPLTGRLVAAAGEAGALHAARSGAGPSAVAFVDDAAAVPVRRAWEAVLAEQGGTVIEPGLATTGVRVASG